MQNFSYKNIYMIGIGGISMSGIAEILANWGIKVSGSDRVESPQTIYLQKHGINVKIGQKKENITADLDLVVYTAAIKEDNEELVEARRINLPCIERGAFLGELTKLFSKSIGISGTHGKTTTTSMLAKIFVDAQLDPTIQVGAVTPFLNANYRVGKSPYFIIEACEYADSFLNFTLESAIVLNIDNDHMEYFKTMENMEKSYQEYVSHLNENGLLVLNSEDERVKNLAKYTKAHVITVGENGEYKAKRISFNKEGCASFDVYQNDKYLAHIKLGIPGEHNVLNSLCAIALARFYNISITTIVSSLASFNGAERRMEYKGMFMKAKVYDDYAHHPTEVLATAKTVIKKSYNESWAVFECHSYSRMKDHLDAFASALKRFDHIIVANTYAAREENVYGVSEDDLIAVLKKMGKDARHIKTYDDIMSFLKENVKENDLIITIGAGTITNLAKTLVKASANDN